MSACGRQQRHRGWPCPGDGLGPRRSAVACLEERARIEGRSSDNGGPRRHTHIELEHERQWRPWLVTVTISPTSMAYYGAGRLARLRRP
jgi:hypothetical protein